jgi:D-alanyl-D-alanine carboxypeptidase
VFIPPIALLALGLTLVMQPGAFGARHEIILERIQARKDAGWVVPQPTLDAYDYIRLATEFAGTDWVVVNKHRPLSPLNYAPSNVREVESSKTLDNSRGLELADQAASALEDLAAAMHAEGAGQLFVNSAYRSYDYQLELFESKTKQYGLAGALVRSAKAGFSEHQTGLAVDVSVPSQGCAIMQCFGDTVGGQWLAQNAWRFGFIVRYEEDTTAITGYTYEPWHLRFVGDELAKLYTERGVHTLEEFWGFSAAPDYLDAITESTND